MSKKIAKKKVEITESKLVELIDNIVNEAVAEKKKEWISEQETAKETLLESKVRELEAKINSITESAK